MTSSAPRYWRRNPISHSLASMSRWFVGSSRHSTSLPANRIAGQLDASTLAARQHPDRKVDAVLTDAQPGRHRPRLALGRVPAPHAEHLLGPRVAVDVALVGSLLHRQSQLLDPFELFVDAAARQHVGHGGAAVEDARDAGILGQVAEPALARHAPGGRFDGATEHPEQARLAGAVAADDADLVAGHDGEAGRLDNESAADLHRELLRLQHLTRLRSPP